MYEITFTILKNIIYIFSKKISLNKKFFKDKFLVLMINTELCYLYYTFLSRMIILE